MAAITVAENEKGAEARPAPHGSGGAVTKLANDSPIDPFSPGARAENCLLKSRHRGGGCFALMKRVSL